MRSTDIDWSGIRAAAVLIGVREAARQAAKSLPSIEANRFVKRVLKRSEREGWIKQKTELVQAEAQSSTVVSGATAAITALNNDRTVTRAAFSKAGRKAAEHLSGMPSEVLLKHATALVAKSWTDVAAKSQGWDVADPGSSPLNLQVLSQNTVISIGEKGLGSASVDTTGE